MFNTANFYLNTSGDLSVCKEMIRSISLHNDLNDLIDNVPNVKVWDKLSETITCQEFLNLIKFNKELI